MRRLLLPALFLGAVFPSLLAAKPLRIAYVPKEAGGEYWEFVHAGALKAVRDLAKQHIEVSVDWLPPKGKGDAAAQADAVVTAAASRPDGLIVAPIDPAILKQPVEYAARNGTPVVVSETLLSSPLVACYVGVNNYQAAQEGAGLLGKLMNQGGGVMIVGDYEGSVNVAQREKGFVQGLSLYPNVQPLYSGDYAAAMPVVGTASVARWLKQFGPRVGGVFSADAAAYAAVRAALADSPHPGLIQMAFGNSPTFVAGLKDGTLQALVADSSFELGYQSVRAMCDVLGGKNVPARVSLPTVLVTPDKLSDPEFQKFLSPPTLDEIRNAPAEPEAKAEASAPSAPAAP